MHVALRIDVHCCLLLPIVVHCVHCYPLLSIVVIHCGYHRLPLDGAAIGTFWILLPIFWLNHSFIPIFTLQTPTNVTNTVACKGIWKTRSGKWFLCRMKLVQEGKSWKARNLQSLPHSKSLTSKSKLSNLCSNSWARLRCYPHFPSFMHIKPRSGCHRLSSNLDWSWIWLAVGSGLPCNNFVWPIVSNLCSLLPL